MRELDCTPGAEYTVPFTLGEGAPASGNLTTSTDGSPRFADVREALAYPPSCAKILTDTEPHKNKQYEPVCDTDLFSRVVQTWTNSKPGTLTSVAVNLAGGNQSTNVQVVVFRFSSLTDLLRPS